MNLDDFVYFENLLAKANKDRFQMFGKTSRVYIL